MAILFDAAGSANTGSITATSLTGSHTCSGPDRLLLVFPAIRTTSVSVTGVTYGGVALTYINGATYGNMASIEGWYLLNPLSGTADIVASFSGTTEASMTWQSLTGVHQSTPLGTAATATGDSTLASVAVSSATDDLVVDGIAKATAGGTFAADASQTERAQTITSVSGARNIGGGTSTEAGAASVTMSWALSALREWAIIAVPVKPSGGAPPPQPRVVLYDTFTDTSGTLLENHTGETGATWTKHPSYFGSMVITDANRVRSDSSSDSAYIASGAPETADQDITAHVLVKSVPGGSVVLYGRKSPTVQSFYYVYLYPGSSSSGVMYVDMYRSDNGSFTFLAATNFTLTLNTEIEVRFQCRDAAKKVFVDGVEIFSSTDNGLTSIGQFGVGGSGSTSNTTGVHISDITGEDFAAVSASPRHQAFIIGAD